MALFLTIVFGLMSVVYGVITAKELLAADPGSARMQEISGAVAEGAQAYLNRQYKTIAYVGGGIFVVLVILLGWGVAVGFFIGATLSGLAGYIGMNVSVRANVRTAQAASRSLGDHRHARRRPRAAWRLDLLRRPDLGRRFLAVRPHSRRLAGRAWLWRLADLDFRASGRRHLHQGR
jgi:hypothetical protein